MTSSATSCREGIAPATLAAWRDGALSPAEAARIAAHVAECPACRSELATYQLLDDALRRLPAPEPDGRLWRAIASNLNDERRRPERRPGVTLRRVASSVVAMAAVLLLALGFAQALRSHVSSTGGTSTTATATPAPQATLPPLPDAPPASPAVDGSHINWGQANLPVQSSNGQVSVNFAIVPGHGETAFACNVESDRNGSTLTLFRTTDRAQHWTTLKQLSEPNLSVSECMVQVDALDANLVLAQVRAQNNQTFADLTWYEVTENGGATWTRLDSTVSINDTATLNGKTYALRWQWTDQNHATENLAVSNDHLRAWRTVDDTFVGAGGVVTNFWLNPNGELLAEVANLNTSSPSSAATPTATAMPNHLPDSQVTLWRSSDGGAHWTAFPMPQHASGFVTDVVVAQPVTGHPWYVCAQYLVGQARTPLIGCTFDGGHTWSARPQICTAAPCDSGPASHYRYLFTMASDGSIIISTVAPGSDSQLGLYRLPRGATKWQYLGPTPGSNAFFFAPTSQGGVLWSYAGGNYLDMGRLTGVIGGHQLLQGTLSTATYS